MTRALGVAISARNVLSGTFGHSSTQAGTKGAGSKPPVRGFAETTAGGRAGLGEAGPGVAHSGAARAAVPGSPRERAATVLGHSPARRVPSRRRALGH